MEKRFSTLELEINERVATITLNRPDRLNAIDSVLIGEIGEVLQALEEDTSVRAIVLAGAGRAFSAGFDLKESAEKNYTTTAQWKAVLRKDFDFIMSFWRCRKPVIAAVHGHCLAGALEVAVACDITIADSTAIFAEPEVKFGSAVVSLILPWIIGPKFAKGLLLTGDDITAQRAYDYGLVNEVVDAGEHLARATKIARAIASAAPGSVQLTKSYVNRSMDIAGFTSALEAALDGAIILESTQGPERIEFNRIRKADGLKAAIEWRNNQK
ncbi:enoyl-CoA hydratase/isomerase family protein [Caballeronia sp. ATUFL_M1_KS5A]|uniref:enoyl-CoA hydratase/isomerase family protein n=1 Tax=Caballeronia sp. ATUFL_M1_KS5A TaxID=2921778 RepID=UPI0020284C0C|nr:enoyl-CoA hydratase/isomerase family protein [Caballeronia sp. ATUFL_M1_KS5A]